MAAAREASAAAALDPEASEALYRKLRPGPGRSPREVALHQRARIHGAMIEIVGERGYDAVTVREVARLAGVSTRTCYEHFPDGLEEAFALTYDLILQQAAGRIALVHQRAGNWRDQLKLSFAAFADEIEQRPLAARFVLVEALTAGPLALRRVGEAREWIETVVREGFALDPDQTVVPPPLVEGIVAGVESVAHSRLLAGHERELPELAGHLVEWALGYRCETALALEQLGRRTASMASPPEVDDAVGTDEIYRGVAGDERALILAAVARLAAAAGDRRLQLTVPSIRAVAGVSRRTFDENFETIEFCLLEALKLHADRALAFASAAYSDSRAWPEGIHKAIAALCQHIASNPVLARLGFIEIFSLGQEGIHCRERFIADISALLNRSFPLEQRPSQLTVEASVGAVWGLIRNRIVSGRAQQLPHLAPALSLMALAPAIGLPDAVEAIQGADVADQDFNQSMLSEASMAGGSNVRPLRQIPTIN